jgi:hypothetical protein
MTLGMHAQYDDFRNYQNKLRLGEAYKSIMQNPEQAKKNPFFQWPGEAWTKKASAQSLAQGFPLANGVVEVRCVDLHHCLDLCTQAHVAAKRSNSVARCLGCIRCERIML